MSHYDGIREADLNAECDRLRAENAALRRLAQTLQAERIDLEDCREGLRALGDLCGCDHVDSPDGRAQQVRHINEAFAALRRQVEEAGSKADVYKKTWYEADERIGVLQAGIDRIAQSLGLPDADPERVAGEVEHIVGSLPKTADGAIILPGMTLINHYYNGYGDEFVVAADYTVWSTTSIPQESHMPFDSFWSSNEAARAAAEAAREEGE